MIERPETWAEKLSDTDRTIRHATAVVKLYPHLPSARANLRSLAKRRRQILAELGASACPSL